MDKPIIERIKVYDPEKIIEVVSYCRSFYKDFDLSIVDKNLMIIAFKPCAETTDIEIDGRNIFIGFKTGFMHINIPLDCKLFYLEKVNEGHLKITNRDSDNFYNLLFKTPRIKQV